MEEKSIIGPEGLMLTREAFRNLIRLSTLGEQTLRTPLTFCALSMLSISVPAACTSAKDGEPVKMLRVWHAE